MAADRFIHRDQLCIVDAVVALYAAANDVGIDLAHEVRQQRATGMIKQVATVLRGVGNHNIHLIEFLARDGVGDQRGLVQGLVVGGLGNDPGGNHGFEGQLHAGLDHRHQQDAVIVVLLLSDVGGGVGGFLESGFRGLCPPLEQVGVVIGPVLHHGLGEVAADDVVLVLLVEGTHDVLEFLGQVEGANLGGVGQAIHHIGNAAVLEALGDRFPAVLDQFGGVTGLKAFLDHLVEAQDGAGLQHAAEYGLFAHQVGLHFGNEG